MSGKLHLQWKIPGIFFYVFPLSSDGEPFGAFNDTKQLADAHKP